MTEVQDKPLPRPLTEAEKVQAIIDNIKKLERKIARCKRRAPNPADVEMVRILRRALQEMMP